LQTSEPFGMDIACGYVAEHAAGARTANEEGVQRALTRSDGSNTQIQCHIVLGSNVRYSHQMLHKTSECILISRLRWESEWPMPYLLVTRDYSWRNPCFQSIPSQVMNDRTRFQRVKLGLFAILALGFALTGTHARGNLMSGISVTLDPASTSGNVFGAIHYASTGFMDHADGYEAWNIPGGGGDVFCVDFLTENESKNGLYLYVHWGLSFSNTSNVNNPWMDEALATTNLNMAPGVPSTEIWADAASGEKNYLSTDFLHSWPIEYEFAFNIPVSWDGAQAVGDGTWSAKYTTIPESAAGEEIVAAVALVCGIMYRRRIKIRQGQA